MRTFLALVILFFSLTWLHADTGDCIRYKAKFELASGKFVVGYFGYATYDSLTFNFTDKAFRIFLDNYFEHYSDTLLLFLKIQTLNYPATTGDANGPFQYEAAVEKNILKISRHDIRSAHFIDYFFPDKRKSPREKEYFKCSGQGIILELTQEEIDSLQQPPIAQYSCIITGERNESDISYGIFSYNSKINQNDLILLCEKLKALETFRNNCNEYNSYACYEREYNKLKRQQREMNVIIIH